jgi:hypothetical protein
MIAFPTNERTPSELDLEHSKQDIALVRGLAKKGLLSLDDMAGLAARLNEVLTSSTEERMKVAAGKALVTLQVSLLRLLKDCALGSGGETNVTNQQINIYVPDNGRETYLTNGNSNGRH